MTLNAFIAHGGICSRRAAVKLIQEGLVTVNGTVTQEPAYRVQETDVVKVSGRHVRVEQKVYIVLNKPKGYITTSSDEEGRATVLDLIGDAIRERIYPIGRLDRNSTGLLLLTNDGPFAQALAHPRHTVQKVYQVMLHADLTDAVLEKIRQGVYLEDGRVTVDHITFCSPASKRSVYVTIHSGKNRVIRRLFEALGFYVDALDRIAYGDIVLRGLPRGGWRHLSNQEIGQLTHTHKRTMKKKA